MKKKKRISLLDHIILASNFTSSIQLVGSRVWSFTLPAEPVAILDSLEKHRVLIMTVIAVIS